MEERPAAEPDDLAERAAASPVRLAMLRAAVVAPAAGLLTLLAVGLLEDRWRGSDLIVSVVFSAAMAVASAPATWAEVRLVRAGRTSPGWALAAGVGATALAFLVAVLAILQAIYAERALGSDPTGGLVKVSEAVDRLWSVRWKVVEVLLPLSAPAGVTALARVRAVRFSAHAGASLALGAALAYYYFEALGLMGMERSLFGAAGVVFALVLPPAALLADHLDRRLWPPPPA